MFGYEQQKDGSKKRKGFPEGCEACPSTIDWDCEQCLWRLNHWKYDEVKKIYHISKMADGGLNINRIKLSPIDFLKIAIIKDYL